MKNDGMIVSSVQRAINMLNLLQYSEKGLTFTEIMNHENLPKTTVFRIINTLKINDFLRYDEETSRYSLGPQILVLGCVAMGSTNVSKVALPIMEELRDATGETVTLYVRRGTHKLCAQKIESHEEIRMTASVGKASPIYVGASGIVLMSGISPEKLDAFIDRLELVPVTSHTIVDRGELKKRVDFVRENKYCQSKNERQLGAAGIGTPVFNNMGQIVASLNVSGPVERFESGKVSEWIDLLIDAGDKLSRELGHR